jgi:hypothetical protein
LERAGVRTEAGSFLFLFEFTLSDVEGEKKEKIKLLMKRF